MNGDNPDHKIHRGLIGVHFDRSPTCFIDGQAGELRYRGYSIHDLAEHSTFEETAYLLIKGELPTQAGLALFDAQLKAERSLPEPVFDVIRMVKDAHPMDALRTAVSALAAFDTDVADISPEATMRKGVRLTSQVPVIVAAHHRIREGLKPVAPSGALGHAANFLYMLKGEAPHGDAAALIDTDMVLHAEHGSNASSFTARVVIGTGANLHAAITAAIAALKGNLHGGAAEATMNTLLEIGDLPKVDAFVDKAFETKRKIMGIGHRIYKHGDPRAKHLLEWARKMEAEQGHGQRYVDMALAMEQAVLRHKELYPNVDFFSAPMLYYLGIPPALDTCIFAMSRVAGWSAHVMEQYRDATLIRPAADYVGPKEAVYTPLENRS